VIVLGKFAISTLKKIDDRVEYGFDLNIKKYCYGHCGDTTYSLQSLIIHKGTKRNKGHYFTLTRRGSKNVHIFDNIGLVLPE
jgi:ubiquitin C-terminal hydrolase